MNVPCRATAVLLTALTVAGCSFGPPSPDQAGAPPRFPTPSVTPTEGSSQRPAVATVLASDLRVPWGLAFLPDGGALVTERDTRRILQVGPESTAEGLKVTSVQTVDEAKPRGEGGLLGIAVSPKYRTDKTVFIYYTTERDNRIAKLTLGGKPQPIVTGIPAGDVHDGGRLEFGPDGFLYAATGDATNGESAQDRKSLAGKILRMTPDGKPAPGNPVPGSLVWALGLRNVQGIAWDSAKRLYATDFGKDNWDEVNVIQPGKNYGWPRVEGEGTDARFTNPIVTWRPDVASCAGAAMMEGTLVVACLRGKRLYAIDLTATGGVLGQPQPLLPDEYGRLRTVVAAPDGSLWVTTSNHDGRGDPQPEDDRILRLVTSGGGAGRS